MGTKWYFADDYTSAEVSPRAGLCVTKLSQAPTESSMPKPFQLAGDTRVDRLNYGRAGHRLPRHKGDEYSMVHCPVRSQAISCGADRLSYGYMNQGQHYLHKW